MSIEHRPDRPNKPWRARVRTPDGRTISRSFTRKIDAEAWADGQKTDQRRGEWVDPRSGDVLLGEWLRIVEETKLDVEASTLATRDSLIRTHIDPTIGQWPINRLTADVLQRWVRDMSREKSPATVRKTFTIVAEALRMAMARSKLIRNPAEGVKLPKLIDSEHRYLTELEVWSLADAVAPYLRPFVLLGAFVGLRPGESLGLRWNHVDLGRAQVRVTATLSREGVLKQPKTKGSKRTISMPEVVVDELARHRERFPSIGYVIADRATGNPITTISLRGSRGWERAVRESVGEPMRPNDLRHSHVGLLIAAGIHPRVIADRLGHSIVVSMDVYGGILDGVAKEPISRLGSRSASPSATQGQVASAPVVPIRQ